jgi:hypothetical protein
MKEVGGGGNRKETSMQQRCLAHDCVLASTRLQKNVEWMSALSARGKTRATWMQRQR